MMTNGDPEGKNFLSNPHTNDVFSFFLTIAFYYFKISFQKSRHENVPSFEIAFVIWQPLRTKKKLN